MARSVKHSTRLTRLFKERFVAFPESTRIRIAKRGQQRYWFPGRIVHGERLRSLKYESRFC